MYLYHLYELSDDFPSNRCTLMEFLKYQAATYELTKLERKLWTFWYYEGRPLSFEEAVNFYTPDALEGPKYRPKVLVDEDILFWHLHKALRLLTETPDRSED
jgi:hypothetical protein